MKRSKILYIIAGLSFLAVFVEIAGAIDNYISPATVPPSTRREGLVRSPSQYDNSGNLLITGNVVGGTYFRGVVPYRAPTDFGVTLPSSALDSFLRDSAGSEDLGRSNLNYYLGGRSYYSPTQTVATTMPGASVIAGVPTANISAYSVKSYLSGTLPVRRDEILDPESALSLARLRPMSMTPAEMQKLIDSEIAKSSPARLTDQQYQPPPKLSEPNATLESYKTGDFKKISTDLKEPFLPFALKKPDSNLLMVPKELPSEKKLSDIPEELDLNKQIDVYDSMKQQLAIIQKKLEQAIAEEQSGKIRPVEAPAADQNSPGGELLSRYPGVVPGQGSEKAESSSAQKRPQTANLRGVFIPYETFASSSEDRFNQNMRAGEMYLKQGKFYRAADAYTLASLYKPDDPLAYAGKSHALFAAGEYMSSALFLARCLQIFPEYAKFKIDLTAMVGDKDLLETRIVNVEECFKKTNAPELQFLLAYLYYRMDRLTPAKEAIETAYKMMPDVPAVLTLKKAIEDSQAADKEGSMRITDDAKPGLSR
jgi:tetratricopeptide (TPR) repeat protein